MYNLSSTCYLCLTYSENLSYIYQGNKEDLIKIKHILPELLLFGPEVPQCICNSCQSTLNSFYAFKRKCLENNHWIVQCVNKRLHQQQQQQHTQNTPTLQTAQQQYQHQRLQQINNAPMSQVTQQQQQMNNVPMLQATQDHRQQQMNNDRMLQATQEQNHYQRQQQINCAPMSQVTQQQQQINNDPGLECTQPRLQQINNNPKSQGTPQQQQLNDVPTLQSTHQTNNIPISQSAHHRQQEQMNSVPMLQVTQQQQIQNAAMSEATQHHQRQQLQMNNALMFHNGPKKHPQQQMHNVPMSQPHQEQRQINNAPVSKATLHYRHMNKAQISQNVQQQHYQSQQILNHLMQVVQHSQQHQQINNTPKVQVTQQKQQMNNALVSPNTQQRQGNFSLSNVPSFQEQDQQHQQQMNSALLLHQLQRVRNNVPILQNTQQQTSISAESPRKIFHRTTTSLPIYKEHINRNTVIVDDGIAPCDNSIKVNEVQLTPNKKYIERRNLASNTNNLQVQESSLSSEHPQKKSFEEDSDVVVKSEPLYKRNNSKQVTNPQSNITTRSPDSVVENESVNLKTDCSISSSESEHEQKNSFGFYNDLKHDSEARRFKEIENSMPFFPTSNIDIKHNNKNQLSKEQKSSETSKHGVNLIDLETKAEQIHTNSELCAQQQKSEEENMKRKESIENKLKHPKPNIEDQVLVSKIEVNENFCDQQLTSGQNEIKRIQETVFQNELKCSTPENEVETLRFKGEQTNIDRIGSKEVLESDVKYSQREFDDSALHYQEKQFLACGIDVKENSFSIPKQLTAEQKCVEVKNLEIVPQNQLMSSEVELEEVAKDRSIKKETEDVNLETEEKQFLAEDIDIKEHFVPVYGKGQTTNQKNIEFKSFHLENEEIYSQGNTALYDRLYAKQNGLSLSNLGIEDIDTKDTPFYCKTDNKFYQESLNNINSESVVTSSRTTLSSSESNTQKNIYDLVFTSTGQQVLVNMNTDHETFHEIKGTMKAKCDICNKEMLLDSMPKHLRRSHKIKYIPRPKSTQSYKCAICKKIFKRLKAFKKHRKIHNSRLLKCELCKRVYTCENYFREHQKTHTAEYKYECEFCKKKFHFEKRLKSHIIFCHTTPKKIECPVCDKKFVFSSALKQHSKSHVHRSYECKDCNKRFVRQGNLDQHRKIHIGEKNFKCSTCNMKFLLNTHLKQHERTHLGKPDFKCSICSKSFLQNGSLRKHMEIHNNKII